MGAAISSKIKGFSYRTSWRWRLLTPIYKTDRSSPYLAQPVGRYADWMEIRQSLLFPANSGTYLQIELSFSHIGPKGGRELQNTGHSIWGVRRQYSWKNSTRMSRLDASGEAGWAGKALDSVPLRFGIGYSHNFLIEEAYAMVSGRAIILNKKNGQYSSSLFAIYTSLRVAHLMGSSYAPVRPHRIAASLKFVLWRFWQPSVSFSSIFVTGDRTPQVHASPFDFLITF